MVSTTFFDWFKQVQQQAANKRHRSLVVLAGNYQWSLALLKAIKNSSDVFVKTDSANKIFQQQTWLTYSDIPIFNANVTKQNYRHKLGTESQVVVFADSEFNIDALAALSGTIIAGGVLFILFPEKISLIKVHNRSLFLSRFFEKLAHSFSSCIVEQGDDLFSQGLSDGNTTTELLNVISDDRLPLNCATQEQYQAVLSIIKVVTGHRNRPLVLTADRGRGKSCALAIACAEIITSASLPQHIIITAPHHSALTTFFKQLKYSLPGAEHSSHRIVDAQSVIEFIPVDQLLQQQVTPTLLIVDEAAGIPVYLLASMLKKYHRVVFSSTVHGYEGAGRGFTLKFENIVNKEYKTWNKQTINQPIRWGSDDPVEQFIFDVCLLNAQLPTLTCLEEEKDKAKVNLSFKCIPSQILLANEDLLVQVFAVLVTAHYQTTPSDLKLLLDNPQVSVLCFFHQKSVVSVALLMREGSGNQEDIVGVKQAKRRLRDQFLPQSLMVHCGVETAFDFDYLRVLRIAVHPQYQSKGIGTLFLAKITEYANSLPVDFIGASFGCNQQLLNFWLLSNYQLARIGFTQDSASGEYSALLLKALSQKAETLQARINSEFYQSFLYLLSDEYRQLSDILVWLILKYRPKAGLPLLATSDLDTVQAFADKNRLYSNCAYSLHLWLLHQHTEPLDEQLLPMIARLLKRAPVSEVCALYQLKGKKALNQLMLDYVNKRL